jgi:hypothetical protein
MYCLQGFQGCIDCVHAVTAVVGMQNENVFCARRMQQVFPSLHARESQQLPFEDCRANNKPRQQLIDPRLACDVDRGSKSLKSNQKHGSLAYMQAAGRQV